MTQNNKPEWFEIIDADEKPELRKVSKSLPVSAVLVAALILGAGVVVAQSSNETPASVISASSGKTPTVESNPTTAAIVAGTVAGTVGGTVTANKLANPAIAQLPTGGGDDDEDDDHERGHHDDEEDDEGDDD
jgi:hypothetical protein